MNYAYQPGRAAVAALALLVAGCGGAVPDTALPDARATAAGAGAAPPLADDVAWATRAPMPEDRTEISVATDGRYVFVIGGFSRAAGPGQRADAPRAVHIYDPAADRWATPGDIPEGVNHAGFVHVDGRLYIVGGFRENTFEPVGNVRIFDIATRRWSEGAPMPTPRGALAVAVVDGRIHAIGGNAADADALAAHDHTVGADDSSVGTHEVYDPATDSWTRRAPMPTARNHHGAAALDGRVHVVAGRVGRNFEMTTHEVYDPATDTWSTAPPVPTGRSGIAVVVRDGRMYVFGGETFTAPARTFDDAERYDPAARAWQTLPRMPTARHGLGAAVVGGEIFVVSGGPSPGFAFSGLNEVLTGR